MNKGRTRKRAVQPGSRRRLVALAGLVLALFAVAAFRAFRLQVTEAASLRLRAEDQRISRLTLLPARGTIYDRNGRELAQSVSGASVFVDPSCVLESAEGFARLCEALGLDPVSAPAKLKGGGSRFAWLERRISPREEEAVRALGLAGVGIATEPHRYYPKKTLAGQVLGFVGEDGKGLGGIEYRYEWALRGRSGVVRAERDARGCLMLAEAPEPNRGKGHSVVLTIDETIQNVVEEELSRAVDKSRARGGVAVALDPGTGEILALAQVPAFNPNSFSFSSPEDRKVKGVVDVYEPGSTFKALFLGILLDRGIVEPGDLVFCERGEWRVHGRTIHDHVPHGWLSVADVLKVSSNVGVAKLSEKIVPDLLYRGLRAFGVGSRTGVELAGESKGILPPPRSWSKIRAKTVAYGQGVSTTVLQVASAIGAIANGGMRMKPRLVRGVHDDTGRIVEQSVPEPAGRALTEETAAVLTRLMEAVVEGEEGTGAQAAIPGYTVAGKTGTSWKPDPNGRGYLRHKTVASFAGFVPSRNPRISIAVAVDEPTFGLRYGGVAAAPAFREMARRILAYLQVPADMAPEGQPPAVVQRPVRSGQSAPKGTMPDLRGLTMREAMRKMQAIGPEIQIGLMGSGVAASQDPAPGARVEEGQACRVVFRPLF